VPDVPILVLLQRTNHRTPLDSREPIDDIDTENADLIHSIRGMIVQSMHDQVCEVFWVLIVRREEQFPTASEAQRRRTPVFPFHDGVRVEIDVIDFVVARERWKIFELHALIEDDELHRRVHQKNDMQHTIVHLHGASEIQLFETVSPR